MGFGDWLHWTSIIRDLYHNINSSSNKIEKIKKYKMKNEKYGILKYKFTNNNHNFKFFLVIKNSNSQNQIIFNNNPHITNNLGYPNIIFIKLISDNYFINNKFLDDKHVIDTYCENLGLKKYQKKCELFFTEEEKIKVNKYIPKKKFIFIEPNNFKIGRCYPFKKFQKIVNYFCDKYLFIQCSPKKFSIYNVNAKRLKNVIYYEDKFTYRETLLLMGKAELCIVNEGGLSIGSNVTNVKTIAIYPAIFNSIMTNYSNVIPISIESEEHSSCNIFYPKYNVLKKKFPNGCPQCAELYQNHNENIIIDKIKSILNID